MSVHIAARQTRLASPPLLFQVLAALGGGFLLFFVLMLAALAAFGLVYAGQIYPGVSVGAVDLSGLKPSEAAALLDQKLTYPQSGKIVFEHQGKMWVARPAELGVFMDAAANAQVAYLLGRSGNPFKRLADRVGAWYSGRSLSPQLFYDERIAYRYLSDLAVQINQPTIEASLRLDGVEVVAVPGQVGRQVDLDASLAALREQLYNLTDSLLPLVVEKTPPEIMDASGQAEVARQILSAPLTLRLPDSGGENLMPWVLPPEQLSKMLVVERVESQGGSDYQVRLDEQALYTYLSALAADVNRRPANARFIFNDDTRLLEVIQPAVIGRNLDVYASIQEINNRVMQGEHSAALALVYTQPEIGDDASGEQLGITEQVIAYTSYFRGSSEERLQNIKIAAANFHGLLVPPGETFSMASVMGDVSLDTGYAEAWIIFGGRTIKGVGGGVCQVSTTLFRAAFFAGFPIIERHPHAYRVGYYEQTPSGHDENLAGLDATVFVPMVDLKFVNDTPYWLLMETYFNPNSRSLTWKFYSTKDGRSIEWETTGPQNVVEPPDPVYEENPELSTGEIKQVDWAAEGADVTIIRTVYRAGQALFTDSFITHYLPWGDIFQYGPGTEIPGVTVPKRKNPRINP
ncbi:MAG: VanW family protein [Anaerolineales bacterium]|nr:VanW family protein [Anaerolineales bacterium]